MSDPNIRLLQYPLRALLRLEGGADARQMDMGFYISVIDQIMRNHGHGDLADREKQMETEQRERDKRVRWVPDRYVPQSHPVIERHRGR